LNAAIKWKHFGRLAHPASRESTAVLPDYPVKLDNDKI
jgi:hypothetical protein